MTKQNNFKYLVAFALISKLLNENKITEQEFNEIDSEYKKKFC